MAALLLLLLAFGVAPFALALLRLPRGPGSPWPDLGSVLLCALAFNLAFFWQELWLVIPKALTPGLHPVLFHNNHDWTGSSPLTGLLQGTGAAATLAGGLAALALLAALPAQSGLTLRLLLFWLAFQGLVQALTQLAIGAVLPGNDVGRALTFLGIPGAPRLAFLPLAAAGLFAAGVALARLHPPRDAVLTRAFAWRILLTVLAATVVVIPFRLPRNAIEAAFVPLFIHGVGAGWLALGAALARRGGQGADSGRAAVLGPALALAVLLALFQLVLRPGIAFG